MAGVRFRIGGIMNSISIDIETFSSNDLSKCGVYKYVEAPDFDILLFGYAIDGGGFGSRGRDTGGDTGCAC